MDWKEYEKEVFDSMQMEYPNASISLDQKLLGDHSKTKRQCDLLIEEEIAGIQIRTVVEAKFHKRPIDLKGVETFIGMLEDLDVQRGIMVAPSGYTKAAKQRALRASTKLELDILNPQELKDFQAHCAIPFAEDMGVLMRAPFGWVVDGSSELPWPAMLYLQGLDPQLAFDSVNFMYIQFWHKRNESGDVLAKLIESQNETIIDHYGRQDRDKIRIAPGPKRNDCRTLIRTAHVGPNHCELTGFADFSDFIFFCVAHCEEPDTSLNLRKIWNLIETAVPAKVERRSSKRAPNYQNT